MWRNHCLVVTNIQESLLRKKYIVSRGLKYKWACFSVHIYGYFIVCWTRILVLFLISLRGIIYEFENIFLMVKAFDLDV